MKKPILSVLICTLPSRKKSFDSLLTELAKQIIDIPDGDNLVEVYYDETPAKEMSVGAKRNKLIEQSDGQYTCFIDDDDTIATDYLSTLLKACQENKDCVELRLQVASRDHLNNCIFHFHINHGLEPKRLQEDVYIYPVGHLCPVRRTISSRFLFPDKRVGEDLEWARLVAPHLKTMATTDDTLYFYNRHNK